MGQHGVEAEELQAYLDRELSPARQAEVERHLGKCQECAALVEELKRVSAALQRWQVEPAPTSLRPPVIVEGKPRRRWVFLRPALALAGTAVVLLLVASLSLPNLYRSRMSGQEARRERAQTPLPEAPRPAEAPPPPSVASRNAPTAQPPAGAETPSGEMFARRELSARQDWEKEEKDRSAVPGGVAGGVVGGQLEGWAKAVPMTADEAAPMSKQAAAQKAAALRLIAYRVNLILEVKEFDSAKERLQKAVVDAGGYIAQASTAETPDQPRRADLVLRVPAEKLTEALEALRQLGRVTSEQLSTDEVTEQVVDLEARLRNARATEQRLVTVLKERTGKVRDILEVEREIAGTREDIERMEAQRQNLMNRVEMATVAVTLVEEFKAQLQPAPVGTGTRLRNAFVEGYESFAATILGIVFFFARNGLNLLFWGGVLWLSWRVLKRSLWRRLRPAVEWPAGE